MEKRVYSVEWLSESSRRNTAYPNVDFLGCRSGASALQYHNEFNTLEMNRPSTAISDNEKENQIDHKAALCQGQKSQIQDLTLPRKAFQEVSLCKLSSASEKRQGSDTDSAKSPESLSEDDATSRPRTKFSKQQLQELEKSFKEHRYIGSNEKKRLSKVLKLSETQIKTWFQNRRMKFKRQSQDARVEAFFSGLYVPYYGYSDFPTLTCPIRPGLNMPLASPASTHHTAPLSATVIRPGNPSPPLPPSNLGSYPYPSFLVHPSFKESVGLRYSPY